MEKSESLEIENFFKEIEDIVIESVKKIPAKQERKILILNDFYKYFEKSKFLYEYTLNKDKSEIPLKFSINYCQTCAQKLAEMCHSIVLAKNLDNQQMEKLKNNLFKFFLTIKIYFNLEEEEEEDDDEPSFSTMNIQSFDI